MEKVDESLIKSLLEGGLDSFIIGNGYKLEIEERGNNEERIVLKKDDKVDEEYPMQHNTTHSVKEKVNTRVN